MLSMILGISLLASAHTAQTTRLIEQRFFEVNDAKCFLKATDAIPPHPPALKITISCDSKRVFSDNFGFAGLSNVTIAIHNSTNDNSTRVFLKWERGFMSGLTVMKINSNQFGTTTTTVFEHHSHNGAEEFEDGDIILAHVGRRFTDAEILPEGTNVYRWKDGKYQFDGSFRWSAKASWLDRYCVIDAPQTCPAERSDKRILDEYER